MRTGLLVAGIAIAVIGAGLMVSLFYLPPAPLDTRSASVAVAGLAPNATRSWVLSEEPALGGSLRFSWNASGISSVSLWPTGACSLGTAVCPISPALVVWNANLSGSWSFGGEVGSAYLVSVTNGGHSPISFSGVFVETYTVPTPSQAVPAWALITLGGLVLLGIGGIATFLGLFLEPGVFRPPRSGGAGLDREPVDPLRDFSAESGDYGDP